MLHNEHIALACFVGYTINFLCIPVIKIYVPHYNPVCIGLIMHAYPNTSEAIVNDMSKIAQLQQYMDG